MIKETSADETLEVSTLFQPAYLHWIYRYCDEIRGRYQQPGYDELPAFHMVCLSTSSKAVILRIFSKLISYFNSHYHCFVTFSTRNSVGHGSPSSRISLTMSLTEIIPTGGLFGSSIMKTR